MLCSAAGTNIRVYFCSVLDEIWETLNRSRAKESFTSVRCWFCTVDYSMVLNTLLSRFELKQSMSMRFSAAYKICYTGILKIEIDAET